MHGRSPSGLPLIDDAIAWIECDVVSVQEVGDHLLVVGHVTALDCRSDGTPLLFYRGGYFDLAKLEGV
jgi:flavin reductase (DIM6/NTAB) family NADH-FMN oxidoreductase RutF